MQTAHDPDTNELLERAAAGDTGAGHQLLARHRKRLRQMVAYRLDRRLAARLDPSDVVQDVLMEAALKLGDYMRDRPLPFYPWLRQIAFDRLIELKRHHLRAQKRSVSREEGGLFELPEDSAVELVSRLVAGGLSPGQSVLRQELHQRIQQALARLRPADRDVLVLRHLEHLSVKECAAALGITEGAVKTRHFRALERLRAQLEKDPEARP